jgi:hypothetical protein
VSALPPKLVIDVGHRLLHRGEFLTLGRFVSEVDAALALAVIEAADGFQLLQIGVCAEDAEKLNAIVGLLPDDRLAAIVRSAAASDQFDDAVMLLTRLDSANQADRGRVR